MDPRSKLVTLRGRGTPQNPASRFDTIEFVPDADSEDEPGSIKTQYLRDSSRSFIAYNDSPDVGFSASINPYRGCEHGCIYCYARPTHEYLGFSAGLDFETIIMVKEDGPELLRRELSARSWKPQHLGVSGVTDPYQPVERKLEITRRCLHVLAEFRNPAIIVTKNNMVTRDADVLGELARFDATAVCMSITTLDAELARVMEPRTSTPELRLDAIEKLADAGVPVGVLVAPVIPGLTDHEMPSIIKAAAARGARFAGFVLLRLPHGVSELFEDWLGRQFPDRKAKILGRLRDLRDGNLNESRFGLRMRGKGAFAEQIRFLFQTACRQAGIERHAPPLSIESFRRPSRSQLSLFD